MLPCTAGILFTSPLFPYLSRLSSSEVSFMLRSLVNLETAYLQKCRARMEDAATRAFSQRGAPIRGDIMAVSRTISK